MKLGRQKAGTRHRLLTLHCRRWRTFERRQRGHDAHVNAALAGMTIRLGLLRERLGEIDADMERWR